MKQVQRAEVGGRWTLWRTAAGLNTCRDEGMTKEEALYACAHLHRAARPIIVHMRSKATSRQDLGASPKEGRGREWSRQDEAWDKVTSVGEEGEGRFMALR